MGNRKVECAWSTGQHIARATGDRTLLLWIRELDRRKVGVRLLLRRHHAELFRLELKRSESPPRIICAHSVHRRVAEDKFAPRVVRRILGELLDHLKIRVLVSRRPSPRLGRRGRREGSRCDVERFEDRRSDEGVVRGDDLDVIGEVDLVPVVLGG